MNSGTWFVITVWNKLNQYTTMRIKDYPIETNNSVIHSNL